MSRSTSELRVRLDRFKPSSEYFTDRSKAVLLLWCGSFLVVMLHVGVCCTVVSVPCSLVVTCWERADLLAVVCVVFSCVLSLSQMFLLVHIGIKGEVGTVKLV